MMQLRRSKLRTERRKAKRSEVLSRKCCGNAIPSQGSNAQLGPRASQLPRFPPGDHAPPLQNSSEFSSGCPPRYLLQAARRPADIGTPQVQSPGEYRCRAVSALAGDQPRRVPVPRPHRHKHERTTLLGIPTRYRKSRSVLRACVLDKRAVTESHAQSFEPAFSTRERANA